MTLYRALLVTCVALAPAGAHAVVWEGFELGSTRWHSSEEGGLIHAAISGDVASEGSHAFGGRVEVPSLAGAPKAGFWLLPDANFTGVDAFHFDIFNGTRAAWSVQLIIQTGNDWGWNAVDLGSLKPGWNRGLGVDLHHGFNGKALLDFRSVPKISILLTPQAPTQGALYLDNVSLDGAAAAALAPTVLPGAHEMLVDSFEGGSSAFKPISGIGVRCEPDPEHATRGAQGLKLVAVSQDPEADGSFGYDAELDLSGVQSAVLDVYNPGPPGMLAFSTAIGDKWDYAAGPGQRLKTGWNRDLVFNFQSHDYKSEASGWKSNAPLPSMHVRRFAFNWSPGDTGSLSLTIDNLRLRAVDDSVVKALAPAPPLRGWSSPLWSTAGAAPAKAGSDQPHARAAAFSPAFSLPDAGPSLRLDWRASERGQSADFEWTLPVDLRGARALQVDAYNPGREPVDLELAVQAGSGMDWMESRVLRLAPGWNHGLELPLEGPVFKHAATQWAYGASLPGRGPDTLRRAYWHIATPGPGDGSIYLAKVSVLRRSAIPGSEVPLAVEGDLRGSLTLEPFTWSLWDSGSGEGSFEKGLSAWNGVVGDSANGASVLSLGSVGASQGKQALRADLRGNGQDKARVVYDPSLNGGPAIPDLSQVRRIRLDVFNPGPPLALSMEFTVGAANLWVEGPQQPLRSGWNRDITFDLEAPVWNSTDSSSVAGATQIRGYFSADQRRLGQIKNINLIFNKARGGVVWVDNIRFGRDGSSTQTLSEAELGLRTKIGPLELKLAGRAGQSGDGNAYALVGPSHVRLRGLGQELAFSVAEAVPGFDDQLGIYTGGRQFDNGLSGYSVGAMDQLSALRWKGGYQGFQAQAFGALPWGPTPFSFGDEALAGLRVKAVGPGGAWVGGTWLHQRLGYDADANILQGPVEQISQILEVDGQLPLPGGLSLGAGFARSDWGSDPERRLLHDADGLPYLWQRPLGMDRDALKVNGTWALSAFELSGSYSNVGAAFDTSLSDALYNAVRDEGKILFKPGALGWKPADDSQGWWPGLGKGLNVSVATYSHASDDKTYAGRTYEGRLENDRNQPLGYVLDGSFKSEHKATTSAVPLTPYSDESDFKLIFRGQPWSGAGWQLGGLTQSIAYAAGGQAASWRVGLDLTQRLWRIHVFSASVASISPYSSAGVTPVPYNAVYAAWRAHWFEGLNSELSYGRPPLGDELSDAWPVTDPVTRLSLEASF